MDFEQGSVKVRFTFLEGHPGSYVMNWDGKVELGEAPGVGWLESSGCVVLRPEPKQRARNEAAQAELTGGQSSRLCGVSVPLSQQKSPRPSKQEGMRTDSHSSPGSTTVYPGGLWSLTEPSRTGSLGVPFTAGTVGR